MMSSLYDIFGHFLELNPAEQQKSYVDSADFTAVRAVEFIEKNYDKDLSVNDIAKAVNISRKHLYNVFNDMFNIPPKQYLIYYRLEKACMRLKGSSSSIQEIAESVGYASQFYFAKEFKRLMKVTPSAYRKEPLPSEVFSYHMYVPAARADKRQGDFETGQNKKIFHDLDE